MSEIFPLALPQGTVLAGQYIIEKVLGQGGFGITYAATDHKTGEKVAVKEFFPDTLANRTGTTVTAYPGEREENYKFGLAGFLQEAETLAQFIGNENIVRIHTYFEENATAYFVMDFVEGESFDEYIKRNGGKVDYATAERILLPVMDALGAVHSKGIVHRDVTPDNIFITEDGTVKLLDFGAARYSLGDKSRSLDVVLKHGFAPKEQYTRRGKQGPFTDIYTVGATFYFAITGKRPMDSIDRLEEDNLVPPSSLGVDIPSEKEDAIFKAMEVNPSDRFQTMGEFKAALLGQLNVNHSQNMIQFTAPAPDQSIGRTVAATNSASSGNNDSVNEIANKVANAAGKGTVAAINAVAKAAVAVGNVKDAAGNVIEQTAAAVKDATASAGNKTEASEVPAKSGNIPPTDTKATKSTTKKRKIGAIAGIAVLALIVIITVFGKGESKKSGTASSDYSNRETNNSTVGSSPTAEGDSTPENPDYNNGGEPQQEENKHYDYNAGVRYFATTWGPGEYYEMPDKRYITHVKEISFIMNSEIRLEIENEGKTEYRSLDATLFKLIGPADEVDLEYYDPATKDSEFFYNSENNLGILACDDFTMYLYTTNQSSEGPEYYVRAKFIKKR